jgi:hypothetical protein
MPSALAAASVLEAGAPGAVAVARTVVGVGRLEGGQDGVLLGLGDRAAADLVAGRFVVAYGLRKRRSIRGESPTGPSFVASGRRVPRPAGAGPITEAETMARVSIGMLVLGVVLLLLLPVVGALVMTAGGFGLALRLEDDLGAPGEDGRVAPVPGRPAPAPRGGLHGTA